MPSLIFAVLNMSSTETGSQELAEFLCDAITSDLTLLFELVRPQALFERLHFLLRNYGDPADVLTISQFSYSELPKQRYVLTAVFDTLLELAKKFALTRISSDDHEHLVVRRVRQIDPGMVVSDLLDSIEADLEARFPSAE